MGFDDTGVIEGPHNAKTLHNILNSLGITVLENLDCIISPGGPMDILIDTSMSPFSKFANPVKTILEPWAAHENILRIRQEYCFRMGMMLGGRGDG